jgi:hypothetical protein
VNQASLPCAVIAAASVGFLGLHDLLEKLVEAGINTGGVSKAMLSGGGLSDALCFYGFDQLERFFIVLLLDLGLWVGVQILVELFKFSVVLSFSIFIGMTPISIDKTNRLLITRLVSAFFDSNFHRLVSIN